MAKDFIPSNNPSLLAWSANFAAVLSADAEAYGISAEQAAGFASLQAAWAAAMELSSDPSSRTRVSVAAREAGRGPMVALARLLARVIHASPGITNAQRVTLGLSERHGGWVRIGRPTVAPVLEIVATNGRRLKVKLRCATSGRRLKPSGVSAATVLSYIVESHATVDLESVTPPADLSRWMFERSTSVTNFEIELRPTVSAGSRVWLCAMWQNPRAQTGPASVPVSAYLAGAVGVSGRRAA